MTKFTKKIIHLTIIYVLSNSFGCTASNKEKISMVDSISPRIAWFMGDVTAVKEGSKRSVQLGDSLSPLDTIVTGKNGNVEIMLGDGGVLKISKNTSLSVQTIISEQSSGTKVKVDYGKVVSVVKKEKKDQEFTVVTPTTIAGVRGTTFLTSVEKPGSEGVACDKDCIVEYAVIEGSIAVKKHDSDKELILEKNTQAVIKKDTRFNKSLVRPLNKESLKKLKELVVLHKNDVLGYSRLIEDLRSSSEELRQFEVVDIQEARENLTKIEATKNAADEVTKTAETSDSKYVKKNANKEYLKIEPEENNTFK